MDDSNSPDEMPFMNQDSESRNESDWVDYLLAYIEALQRYLRITFVHFQQEREHIIRKRSTLFLPAAGMTQAIFLTTLLILTQFFWPLFIAILLIGSLELLCFRTFTPEAIPQSRELIFPSTTAGSASNIFVLTITLMLLRLSLIYHLLDSSMTLLAPSVVIIISITLGLWFIPFSICFVEATNNNARWANPMYPLSSKQLCYASVILIPLFLTGTWFSPGRFVPGLFAAGILIYWIIRKLEDHHIEVTDIHIEGLSSLFQIIFLLICSIDYSFLKKFAE